MCASGIRDSTAVATMPPQDYLSTCTPSIVTATLVCRRRLFRCATTPVSAVSKPKGLLTIVHKRSYAGRAHPRKSPLCSSFLISGAHGFPVRRERDRKGVKNCGEYVTRSEIVFSCLEFCRCSTLGKILGDLWAQVCRFCMSNPCEFR